MKTEQIKKSILASVLSLSLLLGEMPVLHTPMQVNAAEDDETLGLITEKPAVDSGTASQWGNSAENYDKQNPNHMRSGLQMILKAQGIRSPGR